MINRYKVYVLFTAVLIIIVGGGYVYKDRDKKSNPEQQEKIVERIKNLDCENCNLVIVSLTNTRKDHLKVYGYDKNTSPVIDDFFADSLVFDNAFAPASWTLPVAASLFTSLFPYAHQVMDRYQANNLSGDISTLTEILKNNGYQTAAFTGGGDYSRVFKISRGFDVYFDEQNHATTIEGENSPLSYLGVASSLPFAREWLQENYKDKFFLFLQGYDTHCPFTPTESFATLFDSDYKGGVDFSQCLWTFEQTEPVYENGEKYWPVKSWFTDENGIKDIKLSARDIKHMLALYDGEIAEADASLKDYFEDFKKLGITENTIFIFMSEHGDLFGEHGRFMRGGPLRGTFYEPVLNFPFILKHPQIKEQVRIDALMQTVDIMPTLLEMLKINDPDKDKRQGGSMVDAIKTNRPLNDYVYAASQYNAVNNAFFNGRSVIEAIRNKEWKYIKEEIFDPETKEKTYESFELYNIKNDPSELNNLYNNNKTVSDKLKRLLQHKVDQMRTKK